MLPHQNHNQYPTFNHNQHQNSYYQHLYQDQSQRFSQQPQGNPQPQNFSDAQHGNYQYQQGYFVPSSQNERVPDNLPFQNNQKNQFPLPVPIKEPKRKPSLIGAGIFAIIFTIGCVLSIKYRISMNSCQFWDYDTCYFQYEDLCCKPNNQICSSQWSNCFDVDQLQGQAAATFTILSVMLGVFGVLFMGGFLKIVQMKRKEMMEAQVAGYYQI